MNIQELAREAWSEQDIKDMLCNIMDIAKGGSLRHAEFVFKVFTYEPKADSRGQLQIPFEALTLNIVRNDTKHNNCS